MFPGIFTLGLANDANTRSDEVQMIVVSPWWVRERGW